MTYEIGKMIKHSFIYSFIKDYLITFKNLIIYIRQYGFQ